MDLSQFIFIELEEGGKAVEVLRPGTFIDRNGKTVEIAEEDLDAFVANFEEGAAGQDVPVDVLHERAEAAGWVKRIFREGEKLLAEVEWNELGMQLVGDKVYRYLSATIDMGKKLIKSISLVNFPAIKGLSPVELSEGVYSLEETRSISVSDYLQAKIHQSFTNMADDLASSGQLTVEERIELSGAIGEALEAFRSNVGEAGVKMLQVKVEGPTVWFEEENIELIIRKEENEIVLYSADGEKVLGRFPFGEGEEYADEATAREAAQEREREIQYFKHREGAESDDNESGTMTEAELQELREQIRGEIEAELAEKEQTLAELREQVRKDVEAELEERFAERQKLVEFAEEVAGREGLALSVKPDELVEALEAIPAGAEREKMMEILKAPIVDLGERGSGREGRGGKKALEEPYAGQLREWLAGGYELSEWFKINADVVGEQEDYELSEFEKK